MLIYNYKKEFIGIDQSYLDIFNFSNLLELKKLEDDFADFFVKSPGHIHNFEHIHWIDYVLCDESTSAQKVLIKINEVDYTATLEINIIYLTDEPSKKAYVVKLVNLRKSIDDTEVKLEPKIQKPIFNPLKIDYDEKKIEDIQPNNPEEPLIVEDTADIKIKIDEPIIANETYIFDPAIASKELGLPIDLVEEFVQDFIHQANNFKDELYASITTSDFDRVKTLSHKLKGVAANLRIQDALEILTNVNLSQDFFQIKQDIDTFYQIIDRLSIKHLSDDLAITFKES